MNSKVHQLVVSFVEQTRTITAAQQKIIDSFSDRAKSLSDNMVRVQYVVSLIREARQKPKTADANIKIAAREARKIINELKQSWKSVANLSSDKKAAQELTKMFDAERDAIIKEQTFFVDEINSLQRLSGRMSAVSPSTIQQIQHRILEFRSATDEVSVEKDTIKRLESLIQDHQSRSNKQALLLTRLIQMLTIIAERPMSNEGSGKPIEDGIRAATTSLLDSLRDEREQELVPLETIMRTKTDAQQKVFNLVRRHTVPSIRKRLLHSMKSLHNLIRGGKVITVRQVQDDLTRLILPSEKLDYTYNLLQHPELLDDKAVKHLGAMLPIFTQSGGKSTQYDPLFAPLKIQVWIRNIWERMCDTEIRYAQRAGQDLAIAMLDIDHFKNINDTYGHQAGDMAIRDFGKICVDKAREEEPVGRYGGEEFVIVLRDADAKDGAKAAERIRQAVSEHVMQWGDQEIRYTASAGVASLNEFNHTELDQLPPSKIRALILQRADARLYQAKKRGRNRVVYDTPFAA